MLPRPVVILGAAGLLGTELRRLLADRDVPHRALNRQECDIVDPEAVRQAIRDATAQLVINCAACNAVDRAEQEPEVAMEVNARGPVHIARCAPTVVHFSTDLVFDGTKGRPYVEEDEPRPLSAYGRSKAEGDRGVLEASPRCYLLRVGGLYGEAGRNFGSTLLRRLRAGERIRADAERQVQPTWSRPVAEQTLAVAATGHFGLFHVVCHGQTTWAEFAVEMARLAGYDPRLIEPVPTSAIPAAARRPAYAVLENRQLASLGPSFDRMPHWKDALAAYLTQMTKAPENVVAENQPQPPSPAPSQPAALSKP